MVINCWQAFFSLANSRVVNNIFVFDIYFESFVYDE